jgi:hypothetical protein
MLHPRCQTPRGTGGPAHPRRGRWPPASTHLLACPDSGFRSCKGDRARTRAVEGALGIARLDGRRSTRPAIATNSKFESYQPRPEEPAKRASRRTATGEVAPRSILRDGASRLLRMRSVKQHPARLI